MATDYTLVYAVWMDYSLWPNVRTKYLGRYKGHYDRDSEALRRRIEPKLIKGDVHPGYILKPWRPDA